MLRATTGSMVRILCTEAAVRITRFGGSASARGVRMAGRSGLDRRGVDVTLGVAEGEGHGAARDSLGAGDIAGDRGADLNDDVVGAVDGGVRDPLGGERLL